MNETGCNFVVVVKIAYLPFMCLMQSCAESPSHQGNDPQIRYHREI